MEGSGKSWEHGGERKEDEALQFKANGISISSEGLGDMRNEGRKIARMADEQSGPMSDGNSNSFVPRSHRR